MCPKKPRKEKMSDNEKFKKQPKTLEQISNWLAEKSEESIKEKAQERDKSEGFSDHPDKVRRQLLAIVDSHLPSPEGRTLLRLRINGAKQNEIAMHFGVPLKKVQYLEKICLEKIMKSLDKEATYKM